MMLARRNCPACAAHADRQFGTTAYVECGRCGTLVSTSEAASHEHDYYYHDPKFEASERRRGELLRGFFARLIRALPAHVRPNMRACDVLDLGCSRGFFVEACRVSGLQARGVDVSEHAIADARARGLGDLCTRADVLDENAAAQIPQADIITSWELLEHFDDGTEFLRAVRGRLRPGGWFLGSTPNGRSSWLKLLGSHWHGCGIPQYHRVYYNSHSLHALLTSNGFDHATAITCVDWRSSLLLKNTATALTRRYLRTNNIAVRGLVAAAIGVPEKTAEVLGGRLPGLVGDTVLFAGRVA